MKPSLSKRESFLLQVNYRTRAELYVLRRLARKVLDTMEAPTSEGRALALGAMEDCLTRLDGQDQKTWDFIMDQTHGEDETE
jgi:hypothetical protein